MTEKYRINTTEDEPSHYHENLDCEHLNEPVQTIIKEANGIISQYDPCPRCTDDAQQNELDDDLDEQLENEVEEIEQEIEEADEGELAIEDERIEDDDSTYYTTETSDTLHTNTDCHHLADNYTQTINENPNEDNICGTCGE